MAADGGQATDAPQVRRGRKFDQVLEGAREVFMAHGFEGASVDDIARSAGVSKATLYSYFPDKRLLFMEVAKSECARQSAQATNQINMSAPPRVVLPAVAHHLLDFMLSEFGLSFFRVCVAESERFSELGKRFYESGPLLVRTALSEYLRGASQRGEVNIEDFELAADQFGELCKTNLWARRVFNVSTEFSEEEITRVIDGAVDTFLARYGV